jgi:hypothetical protein
MWCGDAATWCGKKRKPQGEMMRNGGFKQRKIGLLPRNIGGLSDINGNFVWNFGIWFWVISEIFLLHQWIFCGLDIPLIWLIHHIWSGWWFGTWILYDFPYIGNSNPNWRTPSFFRGVGQPPTSDKSEWDVIDFLAGSPDASGGTASSPVTGQNGRTR